MDHDNSAIQFAICIQNSGAEDLEVRKVYKVLPKASSREDGYLRVIDESGEDYLYPETYFVVLDLPLAAEQSLLQAV